MVSIFEAINQYGPIIHFVKDQTEELCLEAVKNNYRSLKYIRNQTPQICMITIIADWRELNEKSRDWVNRSWNDIFHF
jgi:hypothetical protein